MGLPMIKERFANPRNTHFAINYFMSVRLGALTEEMHEHLKVSQVFSGVIYLRANMLFSRMQAILRDVGGRG
jgi:hypothetical protein